MKDRIMKLLLEKLNVTYVDIQDDSAQHAGHRESALHGGGHYRLVVVAASFEGKKPIERHRMVYEALSEEMSQNIHALSFKAMTPDEWKEGHKSL